MARRPLTPLDARTGLALYIIPSCEELPYDNPEIANEHHGNHPGSRLKLSLWGLALRNCQIQLIEIERHNYGKNSFHRHFQRGVRLPKTERAFFGRVLWATAGYIPPEGIDVTADTPEQRELTPDEMAFLRTPDPEDEFGYKYVRYRYEPVRAFFRSYVFGLDLELHQRRRQIFLDDPNSRVGADAGRFLLRQAIVKAADPFRQQYRALREEGLLHPAMPDRPDDLIRYKLGSPDMHTEVMLSGFYAAQLEQVRARQTAA